MAALEVDFSINSKDSDVIPDGAYIFFYNSFRSRTASSDKFETVTCLVEYTQANSAKMTDAEMKAISEVHSYHGASAFTDVALQCAAFADFNTAENDTKALVGGATDVDGWMINSLESSHAL